jgi:putative addiction module killer protein
MFTIQKSDKFDNWLARITDPTGKALITLALDKAMLGNFGDHAPVGHGVFEMRIHYGPGYRLYYTRVGKVIYLILLGGTKRNQQRDIVKAISEANSIKG